MKNQWCRSKWVGRGGGAGDQSIRLFMMTGTGLSGSYFPHFSFWVLAPWFEHARWIINGEACIFVGANDRSCGLTASFRCFYVVIRVLNLWVPGS